MSPKTATLEGRPHFVVPVVMGVPGVWNGSNGPLLYTPKDLADAVPLWDGKPVVCYHPDMNSRCMAGSPSVFNRQRVGTLFNTRFQDGKLKAEAWLDPARLSHVDKRVFDAVTTGKMMEVSTGLFTDNEQKSGTFNGKPYIGIARSHLPDHLAILPDEVGACSIAMGAGLCRNSFRGVRPLLVPRLDRHIAMRRAG
jgi:hypothetical protein